MRLRLLAVLALLLFGTAHAAEQNTPSQMARVRITFDRGIRFRDFDLDLALGDQGEALLPPDTVLMEIKIPGTAPIWLSRLLSELRIFPANFSKYGSCYKRLMAAEKNVNVIGVSNCA